MKKGLFIGLTTLDFIYKTQKYPQQNEKIVATDNTIAAGGPVTNASVTFSHLQNQAHLLSVIGQHAIANLIKADLEKYNIQIHDLDVDRLSSPPVSSIIITENTGQRAVISINATKSQAKTTALSNNIISNLLEDIDIILIDGHQISISEKIAQQAKLKNIPVVIDGGSWKEGFEKILPYVDYAICSANFFPPQGRSQQDVFNYLQQHGIKNIAITQGEKNIIYLENESKGEIKIKSIKAIAGSILQSKINESGTLGAIDTLGAGDIFHGAFCHYILHQNFQDALSSASKIATRACQYFGTRSWLNFESMNKEG